MIQLGDKDLRAQKLPTRQVPYPEYEKLIASTDLTSAQFLMLAKPRDVRMTATKIIHDYNLKCVARPIVKVYYDIETAMFNNHKNQVPEFHDRNAFVTVICLTICLPDGKVIKRALLNNHLAYETDGVALDIDLQKFNTEVEMCQAFFRNINELSENHQVICIGHNASTNPRG